MRSNPNRPYTRPAAAMRNTKGFMQIEMADVRAKIPRPTESDLRIHVSPIQIDLSTVLVDQLAYLANSLLENPVGTRISHHEGRQIFSMQRGLGPQVGDVDVPIVQAGHRHHTHSCHYSTRRICTMCTNWN